MRTSATPCIRKESGGKMMLAPPCFAAPFHFQVETLENVRRRRIPRIQLSIVEHENVPVSLSLFFPSSVNVVPEECDHGGIKALRRLRQ